MLSTPTFAMVLIALLTFFPARSWPQSNPKPMGQENTSTSACPGPAEAEREQDLKDDLRKMRALLDQMRANLSFVGNNTSPLNHQFQMEIEMWQMLLERMERRAQTPAAGGCR